MKPQDAQILIRGTEIAERRIRTARRLQTEEVKRGYIALARTFRRLGGQLRESLAVTPPLGK